jgi:hypothetical protein
MVMCMKTTVNISDPLFAASKKLAAEERTTLRALIEEGLRRVLERRQQHGRFRLRRATFRGNGLQPGVREGHWEPIRDRIYEGRGA